MKARAANKRASKPKPLQYTLRNVPPEVDLALRKRARAEGKSLNEVTLDVLHQALNGDAPKRYTDLDHLIGTWVEDPEFDKILAEQDTIDEEMWR